MSATYDLAVYMCPCHGRMTSPATLHSHPGMQCWCYEAQAPVVVVPPKFCPHCGGKL